MYLSKLTPWASGRAPRLTLDLTMIGSQSVTDQAPRGGPPDIWPILKEDAGNLLLTRSLLKEIFVRCVVSESTSNLPSHKRICLRRSQGLLQHLRRIVLLPGKVLSLCPSFGQLRWKK